MGSLVKDSRNRSKYWYACFRSSDGRRLKKSTETADRKTAEKVLQALEQGEELASNGSLTEPRLRELLNQTLERVTGKKAFDPTIREWLEHWLKNEEGTVEPGSLIKYRQAVQLFLKHLGPRSEQRLEAISTRDVLAFRDELVEQGRAPSTVNLLVRKILGRPFLLAHKQGLISINPIVMVKALTDHSKPKKGTFTGEQIEMLLANATDDWRGLILAGLYTGARLVDLARLKWSNVDLAEKTISFWQRKTRRAVKIPIHTELLDHLIAIPSHDSDDEPVFPTLYDKPGAGKSGLSMAFKRLMEKSGVAAGQGRVRKKGGVGRSTSNLSFHSLRHSFNSILANAGVAQEIRQKLTGHANSDMNTLYTHHELATIRAAIEQMPRISKGAKE